MKIIFKKNFKVKTIEFLLIKTMYIGTEKKDRLYINMYDTKDNFYECDVIKSAGISYNGNDFILNHFDLYRRYKEDKNYLEIANAMENFLEKNQYNDVEKYKNIYYSIVE